MAKGRLRALDLFCGAGGASMGLHRAGFDVVGVDLAPQPRYPFDFIEFDALALKVDPRNFDLVWASPPCQFRTAYGRRPGKVKPSPNLIPATRQKLQALGVPYIIENVVYARDCLIDPVMLCGSMFGLDVQRHRLFETTFPVGQPECHHEVWTPRFPPAGNRTNLRKTVEVGVWRIPLAVQQAAMGGVTWMNLHELSESIPPSYSEYLGKAARRAIGR